MVSIPSLGGALGSDAWIAGVDQAWHAGYQMIVLAAPDLMHRPDFGALVSHGVKRGLRVGLVTDGARLGDPDLVERMVTRANLRYAHIRLTDDDVDAPLASLALLEQQGVDVLVSAEVSAMGRDALHTVATQASMHGVLWTLTWAPGSSPSPDLTAAAEIAASVLSGSGGEYGAAAGFPACVWPADSATSGRLHRGMTRALAEARASDGTWGDAAERILPPACAGCADDAQCVGVSVPWFRQHGDGALRAIRPDVDLPSRLPIPMGRPGTDDGFRPTERPRLDIAPRYPSTALVTLIVPGCDLGCIFCDTPQLGAPLHFSTPTGVRACLRAMRPATDGVFFTGGEPSHLPWLLDVIGSARDLGYQRIQMQSHAGRAADTAVAQAWVDAGLTAIDVPLYGPDEATHQHVTRTDGSFRNTLAGLDNLRALGTRSVIHVTLFSSNLGSIEDTLRFLDSVGPDAVYLQVTGDVGAKGTYAQVAPSPEDVASALCAAFEAYEPKTPVWLADVTPCLVPGLEHRVLHWQAAPAEPDPVVLPYSEWLMVFSAGSTRRHGAVCAECSIRSRCDGLAAEALATFGESGLVAR